MFPKVISAPLGLKNSVSDTSSLPHVSACLQEEVWGVAYEIPPEQEEFVIRHLDLREQGGYQMLSVPFHPYAPALPPFSLNIYIGLESNPYFLGPCDMEAMAQQIYVSQGPSGYNREYLFELANAMRALVPNVEDRHLYDLERRVRELCHKEGVQGV